MQIVWDEPKRLANLAKHGMDFASLTIEYFAEATVYPGRDRRLLAIGELEGLTTTVIFVHLGLEAISVISMRPTSAREKRWPRKH